MDLQSILKSAHDERGLKDSIDDLAKASAQLKSLADNVRAIHGILGAGRALSFYNSLANSQMPLQLCAEIASYTVHSIRLPSLTLKEIEKVPSTVKDLMENGKPSRKTFGDSYDPNIVTLFFQYIQKDTKYAAVEKQYEIIERIDSFNSMLGRLKEYFARTEDKREELKITRHSYEQHVTTRNLRYERNWTKMIEDLQERYEAETEKPEDQQNAKTISELHLTLLQCRMIDRFEEQEGVNVSYLTEIPLAQKILDIP